MTKDSMKKYLISRYNDMVKNNPLIPFFLCEDEYVSVNLAFMVKSRYFRTKKEK